VASVQDLSPVCWCISTATVSPALTAHLPATAPRFTLHLMLLAVTSVRGPLDWGMRTHVSPRSTPLTQRSWNVAWEATWVAERAAARARMVDLMAAAMEEVLRWSEEVSLAQANGVRWLSYPLHGTTSLPPSIQTAPWVFSLPMRKESYSGMFVDATAPRTCYEATMPLLTYKLRV